MSIRFETFDAIPTDRKFETTPPRYNVENWQVWVEDNQVLREKLTKEHAGSVVYRTAIGALVALRENPHGPVCMRHNEMIRFTHLWHFVEVKRQMLEVMDDEFWFIRETDGGAEPIQGTATDWLLLPTGDEQGYVQIPLLWCSGVNSHAMVIERFNARRPMIVGQELPWITRHIEKVRQDGGFKEANHPDLLVVLNLGGELCSAPLSTFSERDMSPVTLANAYNYLQEYNYAIIEPGILADLQALWTVKDKVRRL